MDVLENRQAWSRTFEAGWLAHFHETGETDWSRYNRPANRQTPSGSPVDLSNCRLMLISTAGAYLRASQQPFDAANRLGDYSIRTFTAATPFDRLAVAHDHYDHSAYLADAQVLLPLRHLERMVADGQIGRLTDVVSIMGYQPDLRRVVDETAPAVLAEARNQRADAALLIPS